MSIRHLALPIAALLAAAPLAARAQPAPEPQRTLMITGEGSASAAPDMAVTTLTVLRNAETAAGALSAANEAIAAVTGALKEMGVEARDLQTSGFSVNPQYHFDNRQDGQPGNPPTIVGYEVRNSLNVRVRDLGKVGAILDKAIQLGVNQGGDISFQIEDSSELADAARRDAVAKAQASAKAMADAAGVSLGQIIMLSEDSGQMRPPMPMGAAMRMQAADSAVPVEAGENTVTARVRLVYELAPAAN